MKAKYCRYVLKFRQPAGTSRGVLLEKETYFLRLEDESAPGVYGIGECALFRGLSADDVPEYEDKLKELCANIERDEATDLQNFPSIMFGLQTAIYDISNGGRMLPFPSAFTEGESGIPINGLVWMGTYEEMLGRIEEKIAMGFRCIKLKVGAIDFDRELDLVKRIRERFPSSEMELRLDANGGFAPDEALYKLELLSQYSIHSIEQPIKAHQWSYMAELCRESPLPIALDEELIGITDPSMMGYMLNVIRPAYIIIKPSLHGGMYGTMKWIEAAGEHNVKTWITSALESNVGLNSIAHLAAHVYGPHITMPQGLGTGQLFTDNIEMPVEIRGDKLFYNP